jgi:hypothetical protein
MTATMPEINFSELSNKPLEAVRKLQASPSRAVRVRRRGDDEDLVLVDASRAEDLREVMKVTTSLFAALLRHDPELRELVSQVMPETFPWVRFLPEDELRQFTAELMGVLEAADSLGNPTPVTALIYGWKGAAEIYADPELQAILRGPHEELDEVPEPGADAE